MFWNKYQGHHNAKLNKKNKIRRMGFKINHDQTV